MHVKDERGAGQIGHTNPFTPIFHISSPCSVGNETTSLAHHGPTLVLVMQSAGSCIPVHLALLCLLVCLCSLHGDSHLGYDIDSYEHSGHNAIIIDLW